MGETFGWVTLGTLVGVVGKFVLDFLRTRHKHSREVRHDTVREWHEITEHLQQQVTEHSTRLFTLSESHARCERESAELRGELRLVQAALMRQQQATGTEVYDVPPVSIPCLIIADMNGVVKEASPAIAPVLHWLPRDVRGKNVEMLIPERFREAHRAGLERFRTTMQPPWPERSIVTYALAKDGSEVPVAISLTSFPVGANDWLLSATVRRRHAVTDPPSGIYRNGGLMDRGRDAEPDDALSLGGGT